MIDIAGESFFRARRWHTKASLLSSPHHGYFEMCLSFRTARLRARRGWLPCVVRAGWHCWQYDQCWVANVHSFWSTCRTTISGCPAFRACVTCDARTRVACAGWSPGECEEVVVEGSRAQHERSSHTEDTHREHAGGARWLSVRLKTSSPGKVRKQRSTRARPSHCLDRRARNIAELLLLHVDK